MNSNRFLNSADSYGWLSETSDLSNIQSIDDLLKSIAEFIREEVSFNTFNLFEWYGIESFSDLDKDLCAAYDDNVAIDHKIETIYNIIGLVLSDDIEWDEDSNDELADDKK